MPSTINLFALQPRELHFAHEGYRTKAVTLIRRRLPKATMRDILCSIKAELGQKIDLPWR